MNNSYTTYDNLSQSKWINNIPLTIDPLYILDWYTENGTYFAVGLHESGYLKKFITKEIISGLYVWALDGSKLKNLLVNLTPTKIEQFSDLYFNNNASVFDSISDPLRYGQNWKLFKVYTETFKDSKKLYSIISNNKNLSYHIATLGQWNLSTFLMMEMHIRKKNFLYCVQMNNLLEYTKDVDIMQNITNVVFDIETVSTFDHRLPMGDYISDHIMSVTIIVNDELITMFNLPTTNEMELQKAKKLIDEVDFSKYYKIKNRSCLMFNSEMSLLSELFTLFESLDKPYICLGYNSRGYDMPFIMTRAVYLNMPQASNFYYINGILSYGCNMIHVDLNQVIVKFFAQELTSFSLKNVGKVLLEDNDTQKIDFDARNLRYIYRYISESNNINNGYFNSIICKQQHVNWNTNIAVLAKYNEMDCLVVLALWDKLQYNSFIQHTSKYFFLPYVRLSLSKLSEYLSGNMIYEGLKQNTVFSQHNNLQIVKNDNFILTINIDNIASSSENETSSYGGGFNYRLQRGAYPLVYAMDAQAYYPELISGSNLSYETTALIRIRDFLTICKHSPSFDVNNYTFMKFCTHKSMDFKDSSKSILKIEQTITPFSYIHHINENCSILTFDDLHKCNPSDKIIILTKVKKGILSNIIERRNYLRNVAKANKKLLSNHIEYLQNILTELKLGIDDSVDVDDFNEFEDNDAEIDDKKYNISNHYIHQKPDQCDEEYLILIHLDLITKEQLLKFDNKIEVIENYLTHLNNEFVRMNSHYRNMKLLNNSIYGLLGSSYGTLKAKNIAAIVTMLGRKYIIEAARIGNRINGDTIYSDTDSVYFDLSNCTIQKPQQHIVDSIKAMNKNVMLNVKIYRNVFIIGRKTYIAMIDAAIFSRGINKNGPRLWKVMMDRFYNKFIVNQTPLTYDEVSEELFNMYMDTFEYVRKNKSEVLRTVGIQNRNAYKKDTPITKLIDRISKDIPTYVFGSKVSYFYKRIGDISDIHYAMDFELSSTNIKDINLFKFYSNMTMTFYAIISYAIENTIFKKYNVVYKYQSLCFKKVNKLTYLRVLDVIDY